MNALRALALAVLAALLPAAALALPSLQVVSAAQLAVAADRALQGLVTVADQTPVLMYGFSDQTVPAGTLTIVTGQPRVSSTSIMIPLAIAVDGQVVRTINAGYRITQFVHTAVAAHDLASGTVLSEADVTVERVPANGRPTLAAATLVGRQLRASTHAGAPIYLEQTATVELVKAGATAIFIVRDGAVALSADVVVRSTGGLGDTVSVYNPTTRKTLSGVVTGANRVELLLPGSEETVE